jgi:menaquinone-dependent protoporphyrinogen oxidase
MKLRVIVASRHDGTLEIARALAERFADRGLDADVTRLQRDGGPRLELAADDAVVLGSAVYSAGWMGRAQRFVEEHAAELRGRPLWLFSAGARHGASGADVDAEWTEGLAASTGAIGHHVFLSRLDPSRLTFGERFVATNKDLPVGDFRDWSDVRAWADEIADHVLG